MASRLVLENGCTFAGTPFGASVSVAGEVVFNTGMVGYPECFTDPSYRGQILVLTYPLIGNYGVPDDSLWQGLSTCFESEKIHIAGLVVSECSRGFSRRNGQKPLDRWLAEHDIPGLADVDTRALARMLRDSGTMPGKLLAGADDLDFIDPNQRNLVADVSTGQVLRYGSGGKRVVVIDCGCKTNIVRSLLRRGLSVTVVPWDWEPTGESFDGVVVSNGPGDPEKCTPAVQTLRKLFALAKPIFGICLGHQLLGLAAGARTYKLKFGHRSQNQPCVLVGTRKCFITAQNHGYAVDERTLPADWLPWFANANDGSNEGIRHRRLPFWSVQFHPEAMPGPTDTDYLFDEFTRAL